MDAPPSGPAPPTPNPRGAEQPWRRDEVVFLLRAWRQVAAASPANGSTGRGKRKASAPEYKTRIFDAFCALAGAESDAQPRAFKSVMKTRKSLARSFRFIAAFNQNVAAATAMSELGAAGWFALPENEQRRVVAAHYKRKPFAYIDEDMFDAIEIIHAAESSAAKEPAAATATTMTPSPAENEEDNEEETEKAEEEGGDDEEEETVPDEEDDDDDDDDDVDVEEDDDDDEEYRAKPAARKAGRFAKQSKRRTSAAKETAAYTAPKTRGSSESARAGARKRVNKAPTNAWTREDILLLLRAWEAAFDDPRIHDGPAALFDDAVHEGFGKSQRTATALKIKRYSLTKSHKFISDFNKNKYPTVGGRPVSHKNWFSLDKKERNAIVLEHYKKTHFTHLDEDMLAPISRIVQKAKIFEPSTAKLKRSESGKFASKAYVSTPESVVASEVEEWDRRETTLLIRAWRDTVDGLKQKGASNQAGRSLDERIYQRFVVLSEGDKSRNEHDVAARREALTNTYELISDFNENSAASGDWFSMRRNERRSMTAQARQPCVDIDEATFVALSRVIQKTEQPKVVPAPVQLPPRAVATPRQPSPASGGKGLNVWNHDELMLLVNAWGAVVAEGPLVENEPLYVVNNRIYKKFVEMAKGKTNRTDKALIAKRESLLQSYFFISDFNENKIVSTPGKTCDWFALSPADQKYMVKTHFKKTSFSHLDASVVAVLDTFMQPEKNARQASAPPPSPAPTPTPMPKLPPPTPVAAGVRSATSKQDPDVSQSKARPNAWTRDELFSLLRAWREIVANEPRQAKESVGNFNTRIYQRFLALCNGATIKAEASVRSKRQLLTTTYEFIADFNRKNFLDWFSLRESDRKKHIVNANRSVHCCSNIEEDVFEALTGILGDKAIVKAGTRPSSAVFRQRRKSTSAATYNDDSEASDDDDASLQAFERARNAHPKSPARVQADRKRHLIANVLAHIGEQETQSSEALPARKRQKVVAESDLDAIASIFEAQTQHLASLLEQIREERRLEQEERREFLERIHLDQEERQRDRVDRAQDREQARIEWEHFREERAAEREQDQLLLKALAAQKENSMAQQSKEQQSPQQEDDEGSDREPLRSK